MTDQQFDLLTGLMRMRSESILAASRLVLVAGERQADAARETGCSTGNVARAIVQLRTAHEAIQEAYCKT